MPHSVSIITPAYRAARTIGRAAASVLAQTHTAWEWIIVADDAVDYAAILSEMGIADPRIRHLHTGETGSGSPPARNIGLDAARNRYAAILDADDYFHPEKLEHAVAALHEHPLVSTALDVTASDLTPLRRVAAGDDKILRAGTYKFTNISMDSMLVHDRAFADPRFDPSFPCLTDIDFALKLFASIDRCFHIGAPLHAYVKEPQSISNGPGATRRIVETKKRILQLLASGAYPLATEADRMGLTRFYEISLAAEQQYEPRLARQPGLLFEDHLEEFIEAASTSPA